MNLYSMNTVACRQTWHSNVRAAGPPCMNLARVRVIADIGVKGHPISNY